MPPRRSHKKSRNGCNQCKERRVKCDEERPKCTNCRSRELRCSYRVSPRTPVAAVGGSSGAAATTQSPQLPSLPASEASPENYDGGLTELTSPAQTVVEEPKYSVRDLELMHKFCTDTYRSLCGDQTDMDDWQRLILQQAYIHTFLLYGILALAALHTAATATESTAVLSYLNTALQYNKLASAPFRQALNYMTPVNCDAVFAHSAILTVISIAMPCLNAEHTGECFSMVNTMVTVFELLQRPSKISQISCLWLKTNMFSKYDFWTMEGAELDTQMTDAIEQLVRLNNCIAEMDAEQHQMNHEVINLLQSCFAKFVHSSHPATILAWLVYVRKEFVDGLRLRHLFPLLILMHWGVLLDELGRQFWWWRCCLC